MSFRAKLAGVVTAVIFGSVAFAPAAFGAGVVDPENPNSSGAPFDRKDDCSTASEVITGGNFLCGIFDSAANSVLGKKEAPTPESPDLSAGDYFPNLRPENAPDGSPFAENGPTMLASSGLGGFITDNYDQPGIGDPIAASAAVAATGTANLFNQLSLIVTGGVATIERYAYNPTDLLTFLSNFAESATELLRVKIWLPWTAVGLLAATLIMLLQHSVRGRVRSVLWGATWALIVLGIGGIAATQAVDAARYGINGVTSISAGLNDGIASGVQSGNIINDNLNGGGAQVYTDPNAASDAATNAILKNIHFKSWCKQTFGSTTSKAAVEFCGPLWEAQRYTFFEAAQIDANPAARQDIDERKADDYNRIAEEALKVDPSAYENMQGLNDRSDDAALFFGYTLVANMFRVFAALLLMMAAVAFVGYCLAWLVASPILVIGGWGEDLGKALLSGAFKGFVYALGAAVGSWGFMLWTQLALTQSTWFGFVLLLIGTVFFWSLLRPDKKLLALASFGRMNGASKSAKWILDKGLTMLGASWAASSAAEKVIDGQEEPNQETRAENYRRPYAGPVYVVAQPVHEGVVLDKGTSVEPVTVNVDVHTPPIVIDGEVISTGETVSESQTHSPSMDDWDSSQDVDLYTPEYMDKDEK